MAETAAVVQGRSRTSLHALSDKATQDPDVLGVVGRLYAYRSTVRERAHLDRHWRNARTLASHNPVIYKPRVIGDYVINGTGPVNGYDRGRASAAAEN